MRAELMTVPEPQAVKERAFELWSWQCNHSAARTLRVLEQEYADFPDLPLPAEGTIRRWASEGQWKGRAGRELAERYPQQRRDLHASMWKLLILTTDRAYNMVMGLEPTDPQIIKLLDNLARSWGLGAYGAASGGEITLTFEIAEEDLSQLTPDERSRRMRGIFLEQNTGTA
jgi:hypothetical protein